MQDLGIRVIWKGNNFIRLLEGLGVTIRIALIAIAISIVLGILLGVVMTSKNKIIQAICRIYLEAIRIIPQLVWLFIVYFGVAKAMGVHISGVFASIIVFSLWGTAEMGDIVRGALISIPKHQYESGAALGLTRWQIFRYIIIPQTLRRLIPNAINLATRMIKTTSLVALIGVVEVLKVGKQIIDANRFDVPSAALWIYGVVFVIYFIICYPVSLLSKQLEKKWND